MSHNATLQASSDSASSVDASSNSRARKVEENLALFRTQLHATQATLDEFRISHAGCAEEDSRIVELVEKLDLSEHHEVQTGN